MKTKTIKVTEVEYEQIKRVREFLLLKGTDSVVCKNCGYRPEHINLSYGGVIDVSVNMLLHYIDNPDCMRSLCD